LSGIIDDFLMNYPSF